MPGGFFVIAFFLWLVLYPAIVVGTIVKRAVERHRASPA